MSDWKVGDIIRYNAYGVVYDAALVETGVLFPNIHRGQVLRSAGVHSLCGEIGFGTFVMAVDDSGGVNRRILPADLARDYESLVGHPADETPQFVSGIPEEI